MSSEESSSYAAEEPPPPPPSYAARTTSKYIPEHFKLSAFLNTLPTFFSDPIQKILEEKYRINPVEIKEEVGKTEIVTSQLDLLEPEIVTSRPDLIERSLQLMEPFRKKRPSAKELMFAAVSTDFIGVSENATIKALKVFVTLTFTRTPIMSELKLKLDEEENIIEFWSESQEEKAADPFVNAVFLYIAFQSQLRRLEARYRSMLETYDYRTFPEYIHHLPVLLQEFITEYHVKTSYEATSFTTVGTVIPCLQNIQRRNICLENSYRIMELLDKLSMKITEKEEQEKKRFTDDVLMNEVFFQQKMRNIYEALFEEVYKELLPDEKNWLMPFFDEMRRLFSQVSKEVIPKPEITNYFAKLDIERAPPNPNFAEIEMDMGEGICVVGRSGYGKTNSVLNFIKRTNPDPMNSYWKKIVVFSGATTKEPLYENLPKLYHDVQLIDEVSKLNQVNIKGNYLEPKLIIFDDFITLNETDREKIKTFAAMSRHQGWTRIFIVQKLLGSDGLDPIIRGSCRYFMLFRINNKYDFNKIRRELMGIHGNKGMFLKCYEEATRERLNFFLYDKTPISKDKRGRKNFLGFCGSGINDELINFYNVFDIQKPPRPPSWDTLHIEHPARICIVGATGSGKSNLALNLLSEYGPNYWKRIVIFSPENIHQALYDQLDNNLANRELKQGEERVNLERYNNIEEKKLDLNDDIDDMRKPKLIIFDDFITKKRKENALVRKYAIASRKYGWTCMFLVQKFAGTDGLDKVIRDQCTYYFVMPGTSEIDIGSIKKFVNVDTKTFETSYDMVQNEHTSIRNRTKNRKLAYPFVMIDEETDDIKLKVRIGFDFYYSKQENDVVPVNPKSRRPVERVQRDEEVPVSRRPVERVQRRRR